MVRRRLLILEGKNAVDQVKANVANTQDPAEATFEIAKEVGVHYKKATTIP